MLAAKTLIDYTSLFSPYHFEKNDNTILSILKMIETTNIYSNLSDETKSRLNEISKIKYYFHSEIPEKKWEQEATKIWTTTVEFRNKLGFDQFDVMIRKEPSVLTKIMKLFAKEEILLQHFVLSYKINVCFPKYKLAIEFDERRHRARKKRDEDERQKVIKEHLDCYFIRINPDGKIIMSMLNVVK